MRLRGECRAKQAADKLGSAGKASQDQIQHIPRERMSLSGMTGGLEWGILVGIFSWGLGHTRTVDVAQCRCWPWDAVGGMVGMGHHSQLCPRARVLAQSSQRTPASPCA